MKEQERSWEASAPGSKPPGKQAETRDERDRDQG